MYKDFSTIMENLQNIEVIQPTDIILQANYLYNKGEKMKKQKIEED